MTSPYPLLAILGFVLGALTIAASLIYVERRLLALWQDRYGPNRVGPNLWGVVGRPKGSEAGFDYSAAMKAKGGNWTIDDLNQFLTSPKTFVPGTKMTFAGLPKIQDRADVIGYLQTLK